MAEEPMIELDVSDVGDTDETVEESTAPEESSPEEKQETNESEEEAAPEDKPEEDSEDTEDKSDESETEEPEKAEETPEELKKGAESRKDALNTEIRELVSKRNELRQSVQEANSKAYRTQSEEELVNAGYTEADARVEALEQRQQMFEYNTAVADLNSNLNIESVQVMADFPVFNPEAPEYDEALAMRARDVYLRAANPQVDEKTGLITQANVLPYDIYKAFAETKQSSAQDGAVRGQEAAEKMLAATDNPSSSAPKKPKEDAFLKGLLGQ